MVEARKSNHIGMRRGRVLASFSQTKQLDLIAEGLPILMDSVGDLLSASMDLGQRHRAAHVLNNHALEEAAKILILVDIVRCPPKVRPARIGPMMGWFYEHLARLIYTEAQTWRPVDVDMLQEYVDHHRRSHYLEGGMSEYIMPNMTIFSRESLIYADLASDEHCELFWIKPETGLPLAQYSKPAARELCEALQVMGVFTREGLNIISSVWSQVNFVGKQHWSSVRRITEEMLLELERAKLITEGAQEKHLDILYDRWQMPMYHIDFKMEKVELEDLQAQRDASFWAEIGHDGSY